MAARCQHCRAEIRSPKRSGRKAAFCSDKCRDAARRTRNFEGSGNTRKRTQAIPRNASKRSMISNPCKGDFADQGPARSVPINLLGGGSYRWPGARPLDPETRAKIYWCEIGEPPAGAKPPRYRGKRQAKNHVSSMLNRIRSAHPAGKHKKAMFLSQLYLNSNDARLVATELACRTMKPHRRLRKLWSPLLHPRWTPGPGRQKRSASTSSPKVPIPMTAGCPFCARLLTSIHISSGPRTSPAASAAPGGPI